MKAFRKESIFFFLFLTFFACQPSSLQERLPAPPTFSPFSKAEPKPEEPLQPVSFRQMLGQSFVVGIPHPYLDETTRKLLQEIKPAGIVLYRRNYQSPVQLKQLIEELQKLALQSARSKYFIFLDEEPGGATRLGLFQHVFASGTPHWKQIERDIKILKELGVNALLSPLVDYPFKKDAFLKARIPANTPQALIRFNRKFIELLHQSGIQTTLKHFPGLGVFEVDPHKRLPRSKRDRSSLEASLALFKDGIDAQADFVMTGHAIYDEIDRKAPATLSKKIVTQILREELQFKGLILTDDLSDMPFLMGQKLNLTEGTMQALLAGHDLVLFSHELSKTRRIFQQLLKRGENNKEFKRVVEENHRRILEKKRIVF